MAKWGTNPGGSKQRKVDKYAAQCAAEIQKCQDKLDKNGMAMNYGGGGIATVDQSDKNRHMCFINSKNAMLIHKIHILHNVHLIKIYFRINGWSMP